MVGYSGQLLFFQSKAIWIFLSNSATWHKPTSAEGFLFLQDHMVLNYWNLLDADKAKLWITNKVKESWSNVPLHGNKIEWFKNQGDMVKKAVGSFPFHYQANYKRSVGEDKIIHCSSETFYIPRRHIGDSHLVKVIGSLDIHHCIAVPMLFLAMGLPSNFESKALAKLVYRTNLPSNATFSAIYTVEAHATMKVQNEMDFVKLIRVMASGDPFLTELVCSRSPLKLYTSGWEGKTKQRLFKILFCSSSSSV